MNDSDNIFDTSTTLTEVEEPAGDEGNPPTYDRSVADPQGEPDYFTPSPSVGHRDVRRRALAVLALVGGGIFTAVLISAATGSGNDHGSSTPATPARGERSVPGRTATIVAPPPRTSPQPRVVSQPDAGAAHSGRRHHRDRGKPDAPAHRQRHRPRQSHQSHQSPAPSDPAPAPPPETSYSPEPEAVYVPVEEAPAPPPPPSSPSPPREGQQEFGIEP